MEDRHFIKLVVLPVAGWFGVSAYGVATAEPAAVGLFTVSLLGSWLVARLLYRAWKAA
jgi:hypothetical protein